LLGHGALRIDLNLDPERTRRDRPRPHRVISALLLLPGALSQVQRRPDEAELLAESALDESQVRRFELARPTSTNVGGIACAWVPNSIFGCLPLRTGCGCSATRRPGRR
jgi:hypothetical protein